MNSKPYLTYQEYKELGGTLDIMPFNLLEFEARANVDKYTFGRLKNLDEQLEETEMCVYELIGILASYQEYANQNKSVSSESTDGYSISYTQANESVSKTKVKEIKDIIETYLSDCKLTDGTPYLYRG
jgi:hypothetical protein